MHLVTKIAAIVFLAVQGLEQIPRTEGNTLAQQPLTVADAIKGKPALLMVTFSKSAGDNAVPWTKALQDKGLDRRLAIYQVAELEDVPRMLRRIVISMMRKGVPAEKHGAFVILTSDTVAWQKFVGYAKAESPYLVLIDPAGAVRFKISGEKTDEKLKRLTDKLQSSTW